MFLIIILELHYNIIFSYVPHCAIMKLIVIWQYMYYEIIALYTTRYNNNTIITQ